MRMPISLRTRTHFLGSLLFLLLVGVSFSFVRKAPAARFTTVITGNNYFYSSSPTGSGNISGTPGATVTVTLTVLPGSGFYYEYITISGASFTGGGSTLEQSGAGPYSTPQSVSNTFVLPASGSVSWTGGFATAPAGSTGNAMVR